MSEPDTTGTGSDAGAVAPDPPTDVCVAFVRSEIERWRRENLINDRLAKRMLADYDPKARRGPTVPPEDQWPRVRIPLTPSMVLLYLGGLLIVVAAVMLLDHVWGGLGDGERLALVLLPALSLYGAGGWLHKRVPDRRVPGQVMLLFACVLVPIAAWLASVCVMGAPLHGYSLRSQVLAVALVTLVVHLATLHFFRSPVLTVPYPLSAVWLAGQAMNWAMPGADDPGALGVLVCGLVLVAVGVYCVKSGKPTYATMPDLVGTWAVLNALFFLALIDRDLPWEIPSLLATLVAIGASVWWRNQRFLFIGAFFLVLNIFYLGFEYFKDTADLPLTLLICGALSMALGYGVHRVRQDYVLE